MAKNKYIIITLILVLIGFTVWYVLLKAKQSIQESKVILPTKQEKKIDSEMLIKDTAQFEAEVSRVNYSFLISPEFEKNVKFKISGKIEDFKWKKGDRFKRGDLLFQLDNRDLFREINTAKEQLKINVSENLKEIEVDDFKQIWRDFSNRIVENDLLPQIPSFYAKGFKEIQINNKVISAIDKVQQLESQIFDYFYIAPFDGAFKSVSKKRNISTTEIKQLAVIYPIENAIIKGEIEARDLEYFKVNDITGQSEHFVKSQHQQNGKIIIFKKIKKRRIPNIDFYEFYVLMN